MQLSLILVAIVTIFGTVHSKEILLTKRTVQCENIFSVKVCNRFREIGSNLKLKANEIDDKISDAYNKGITKADEIKSTVEKYLQEKILSKTCEDLMDKTYCDKLTVVGSYLQKTTDQMKEYIAKAMLQGFVYSAHLKDKIEDYIRSDLMEKTCVDVLPVDKCQQISDIGSALKLKAEQVKNATVESILNGYHKIQDTVMVTLTKMKKYAEAFTCEELLNPDLCVALRAYAVKIRIGMPKMMNAVRSAIVMGYKVGKGFVTVVYKLADAFIDCEHFLSTENCQKIEAAAKKIGATAEKIKEAIVETVNKGITEAKSIYQSALDFLNNKFGRRRRSIMEKRDLKTTLEEYRKMLQKGISQAHEYLKKSIEKTMEHLKIADVKIRDAIMKAIEEGHSRYEELKTYIKDLLAKKTNDNFAIVKRDTTSLRSLLTKALSKTTGLVKATIVSLLNLTNEQLQSMKRYVQKIIDSVFGMQTKRDIADETLKDTSNMVATASLKNIEDKLTNDVQNMMTDIVEDVTYVIHDVTENHFQKRQIDDLSKLTLKDIVESILKNYVGKAYEKISVKTEELIKSVREALKSAGSNMIDVSKKILQKIEEMLEKLNSESVL